MKYEKPEAVKLDNAIDAVQGIQKSAHTTDSAGLLPTNRLSVAAYESDE